MEVADRILRLFGHPHLEAHGSSIEISSRKGMALLAYLATEDAGRAHMRDQLAALLWPDYDETRARANLRRTLYTLNKSDVADWIAAAPEQIELQPESGGWVDVVRFASLQAQVSRHDHDDVAGCVSCLQALQKAVSLYDDDFLVDFYLPDSSPFEEWAEVTRDKYRRQALDTMHTLAGVHLAQGEFATAEQLARRQLEIDNLREDAWRQLLQVLALSGRRSAALAEYESLRRLLKEELDVVPAPATEELVEAIREGALSAGWEEPAVAPQPVEPQRTAALTPPVSDAGSPYRGLFAFREEDAPLFFGREAFTEQLLEAVAEQAAVAIIGPSGSGKSSVLFAGLIADLRPREEWLIVSFRPGGRPLRALATALIPLLEPGLSETDRLLEARKLAEALADGELALDDVVNHLLEKHESGEGRPRLLLAVDQFEELYTLCQDEEQRRRFLDALLPAVFEQQFRPAPRFTLALTLRADFVPQALAYRPLADALREADVKLGPMMRAELARAVERPAALRGVTFEPGLVTRILDDVGAEPGNLPLLQFALAALWERREEKRLTHAAYEAIGRVDGALAGYAEEVFESLAPEAQAAARRILIQVVRPGEGTEDTRRLATRQELAADNWPVVQRLADARLLVTGRDVAGEQETVEVVHEALIGGWDRLRRWMAADREFRVWQERLRAALDQWQASDRDEGALLRGVALATAEQWLAERPGDLSDAEKGYIRASLELRRRRRAERRRAAAERARLRRRFTQALALGLLLALVLAAAALIQWRAASSERDAARTALGRQLAAQALNVMDDHLDRALLIGVEAVRQDETAETRSALSTVLSHSPSLRRFIHIPDAGDLTLRGGISADARLLALGSAGEIRIWDLQIGEWVGPNLNSPEGINSLITFSPDNRMLATIGDGVQVFDVSSGEMLHHFRTHPGVTFATFGPQGRLLASASEGTIGLWDLDTGKHVEGIIGGRHQTVAFSPDGRYVAGGGSDNSVLVWRVESGEFVHSFERHEGQVTRLAFSPDGRLLASGSLDGAVYLWDVEGRAPYVGPLQGEGSGVSALAFSPGGDRLATGSTDGLVHQWQVLSGELLGAPLRGHSSDVADVAFSPDGQSLYSGALAEGDGASLLSLIEWRVTRPLSRALAEHLARVEAIAFGGDEDALISVDNVNRVRRWQIDRREPQASPLGLDTGRAWSHAVQPGGNLVALGLQSGPVLLKDATSGETVRALDEPPLPIAGLAFTPDGELLAGGGCGEGSVTPQRCDNAKSWVWETASGDVVGQTSFELPDRAFNDVAISDDGRMVASGAVHLGGSETRVYLWETESGRLLSEVPVRPTEALGKFALAFNPDGNLLSIGGADGLEVWEIAEDAETEGVLERKVTLIEGEGVVRAAFSPDGRYLAGGQSSGALVVWDVSRATEILRAEGAHEGFIASIAFSPGGQWLASGGDTGELKVWDLSRPLADDVPEDIGLLERACRKAGRNLTPEEWQQYFGEEPYRGTCGPD